MQRNPYNIKLTNSDDMPVDGFRHFATEVDTALELSQGQAGLIERINLGVDILRVVLKQATSYMVTATIFVNDCDGFDIVVKCQAPRGYAAYKVGDIVG